MAGGGSHTERHRIAEISTVAPDALHAHKTRKRRHDGFSAHMQVELDIGLTTTVSDPKPPETWILRCRATPGGPIRVVVLVDLQTNYALSR
jgi:hypothetical protein